jgi:hypothetical protein
VSVSGNDRLDGGSFTNSGGPGSSFPNHLRWMIFWNYSYDGTDKEPIDFWEYSKNGVAKFVKPLFVGLHGKTVSLDSGTVLLSFDYLLLATGARHAYFGHAEWEQHALPDANRALQRIASGEVQGAAVVVP